MSHGNCDKHMPCSECSKEEREHEIQKAKQLIQARIETSGKRSRGVI